MFVDAFAFDKREKLKLSPDDAILRIYRLRYPHQWMADALEVEILAKEVQRRYGVPLDSVWHEQLTLGELFAHTRRPPVWRTHV